VQHDDQVIEHSADLDVAMSAARRAAEVGLSYFERLRTLAATRKLDGSLVTEADVAVESAVKECLAATRPDDAFLGEETGASGSGPRRWILDGIDGTAVFVFGDDRWQSLIALEVDGVVQLGVAVVPAQGDVWWAVRGQGAHVGALDGQGLGARQSWTRGDRCLAGAEAGLLPPLELLTSAQRAEFGRLPEQVALRPWRCHAALLVAAGELDVAAQVGGHVWDCASLSILVEEAGGRVAGVMAAAHPLGGTVVFAAGQGGLRDAVACLT